MCAIPAYAALLASWSTTQGTSVERRAGTMATPLFTPTHIQPQITPLSLPGFTSRSFDHTAPRIDEQMAKLPRL